jgi:drug/metabolite transporter (DMT)-like permease
MSAIAANSGHAAANRKSILAMLASQAVFTANDACVKLATETLPLGQIIAMRNGVALACILAAGLYLGGLSMPRGIPWRPFSLRIVGEISATVLFLWALARMPIADITFIGQLMPLAITAAGALFLREPVGWRRWVATLVGLVGVLLIIRPGTGGFTLVAVIAILANLCGVLRDLSTRAIGPGISTLVLTASSVVAVMSTGLALLPFESWRAPEPREIGLMLVSGTFLALGYVFLIVSLRTGELAVSTPFRYSVVLWAILAGYLLWGELPDAMSLAGIAILVGAGLYTFHREHVVARSRQQGADRRLRLLEGERL